MLKFIAFIFLLSFAPFTPVSAQENITSNTCSASDRACVIAELIATASNIGNTSWRDQSYREIAKTLAGDAQFKDAIDVWEMIENPDTKALTIRGIGMAVADHNIDAAGQKRIFDALRAKTETIDHAPSYAIALTYIAMAQAFAGDDAGAWATAASMENDALRHKAYGETAEIQAEAGNLPSALKSIGYIESSAYRNKSYALVSKILADGSLYDEALKAATPITNAYKKAKALQYVLDKQALNEKQ